MFFASEVCYIFHYAIYVLYIIYIVDIYIYVCMYMYIYIYICIYVYKFFFPTQMPSFSFTVRLNGLMLVKQLTVPGA